MSLKYNLQFFAKEGPGGEKTEKPTAKKRSKAREEGQVAKSMEVNTAFILIFMFLGLKIFSPYMWGKIQEMFSTLYGLIPAYSNFLDAKYTNALLSQQFQGMILMMSPLFGIAMVVGLFVNFMQVGWHPSLKPLTPKLSKVNPINGVKRLFSLRTIIELLKTFGKAAVIIAIIYTSIAGEKESVFLLFDMTIPQILEFVGNKAFDIGIKIGIFYLFIALGDYLFQRYEHEQNLKMTKQEVKEEHKTQEGNPEVKSKIRQKMREISMRRMMQNLPKADVIITNPTHFAIAIQYAAEISPAPIVIAKGADYLAARIRKKAVEEEIEIVENKPLARTLYYNVEIGEEIPPELYQSVAEVLAFVYSLKQKKGREADRV